MSLCVCAWESVCCDLWWQRYCCYPLTFGLWWKVNSEIISSSSANYSVKVIKWSLHEPVEVCLCVSLYRISCTDVHDRSERAVAYVRTEGWRKWIRRMGKRAGGIHAVIYANTCHPSTPDPPGFLYSVFSFQSPVDTVWLTAQKRQLLLILTVNNNTCYSLGAVILIFNFMMSVIPRVFAPFGIFLSAFKLSLAAFCLFFQVKTLAIIFIILKCFVCICGDFIMWWNILVCYRVPGVISFYYLTK